MRRTTGRASGHLRVRGPDPVTHGHRVARTQPRDQTRRLLGPGTRQAQHELVSTKAPQQVPGAQLPLPAPCQLTQQRVPRGVPVDVVDGVEAVQFDRDGAVRPSRAPQLEQELRAVVALLEQPHLATADAPVNLQVDPLRH